MKKLTFLIAVAGLTSQLVQAATPNSSAKTSAVAPSQQTTTIKAAEVKPAAAKKWGAEVLNWNIFPAADINTQEYQNGENYNWVGVSYKLNDNLTAGARQTFTAKWNENDNNAKANKDEIDDLMLFAKVPSLAKMNNDVKLGGEFRVYLPGSAVARDTGRTTLRADISASKNLSGKWATSYLFNPRYYHVTDNRSTNDKGEEIGNRSARLIQEFKLKYNLTDKIVPYQTVVLENWWLHRGGAATSKSNVDLLGMETGAEFTVNDNFSVGVYAYWERDIRRPTTGFALYRDTEVTYNLQLFASM